MSDTNSLLGTDFDRTNDLIGNEDTAFLVKVEEHATVQALVEAETISPARSMEAMGRVTKIDGSATVVRNGIVVTLNVGDAILKGDILQTASNSALDIILSDGTVFHLGSDAEKLSDFAAGATELAKDTLTQHGYPLSSADFGFCRADESQIDAQASVKISTLPSSGMLTLHGIAVTAGQLVSIVDIKDGKL